MKPRRILGWTAVLLLVVAAGVYVFNASWRVPAANGEARLMAHRGVHQTFDLAGVENDTCTATRIREPIAPEIENTLASMGAAFALGADVVELDVHPTTDGRFAVFHDWTLDCRTEGTGETRDHNMAYLKTLDIGYGYTVDGGRTFPLRGTGAGLMPSFSDVMAAFPGKKFLVNFKSNEAREGDTLADMLEANPEWRDSVWAVYGGDKPTNRAIERIAGLGGFSLASLKACLIPYLALGWTGYIPNDCRDTVVIVPINYAAWMWGWPNLFLDRMRSVGSDVMLRGPYTRGQPTGGIDAPADVAQVPAGFDGYVWTNEIAAVAPLLGPQ